MSYPFMRAAGGAGPRLLALAALLGAVASAQEAGGLTAREKLLLERIAKLEERVAALELRSAEALELRRAETLDRRSAETLDRRSAEAGPQAADGRPSADPQASPPPRETAAEPPAETPFGTISTYFDGYYAWNTNRPADGVSALRAYDRTANGFSVNQAGLLLEKAPDIAGGRRWGYRLDLMYGQATQTLQGSASNEPRPQVYRPVFQAYGTYVAPVGSGLTVDFGKWASALGYEGNYTKDQINYSRSYFFNFLPFYHMGVRTSYAVNGRLSLGYWLVNGANQTEDFNGAKSQLAQVVAKPWKDVSWTLQYYAGREQPGTAGGMTQIVDTYASWTRGRLTLAGELDYVTARTEAGLPRKNVTGGAAYARYQLTSRAYLGQRYTRLNDPAGLFSGTAQSLNDLTSTAGYRFGEGFESRLEFRRDFSDRPFFLTSGPGRLAAAQNTVTLGLLWWFGGKRGAW